MTHIEEARKLLAAEYDAQFPSYAELARTGIGEFTMCSVRAIASALAAAEERGRIEERERCAIETGGVLVEMPSHLPNLMARVLAYLEGSDPKATSGGERNSDLRDGVRKVLEASK